MPDHVITNRNTGHALEVIGSYLESFAAHQAACGYASRTVQSQRQLLGHFNEWLMRRRCDIHQLNDALVDTFLKGRQRRGRLHRGHATTVHQFLAHLRAHGVIGSPGRRQALLRRLWNVDGVVAIDDRDLREAYREAAAMWE